MDALVLYPQEEHFESIWRHIHGLSFVPSEDQWIYTNLSFVYQDKSIKIQIGKEEFLALNMRQLENTLFNNIDNILGGDIWDFKEAISGNGISLKDSFLLCLVGCVLDEKDDPFKAYIGSRITYILDKKEENKIDFIADHAWKYILRYPRNSIFWDELSDDVWDIIKVITDFSRKNPELIEKYFDPSKANEMRILSKIIYKAQSHEKLDNALLFLQEINDKEYLHQILGEFNSSTNLIHFLITQDIEQLKKLIICIKSCSPELWLELLWDSRFMEHLLVDIPYEQIDSLCINSEGMLYLYNNLYLQRDNILYILGCTFAMKIFRFLDEIEEFSNSEWTTYGDSKPWCFMEYVASKLDADKLNTIINIYSPKEISDKMDALSDDDNIEEIFL